MSIVNLYNQLPARLKQTTQTYPNYNKIKISIPNRILLVAPTGEGKTNLALNLILLMGCFTKIYIFAKCHDSEPLWLWFIEVIRKVEAIVSKKARRPIEILKVISADLEDLPEVEDFDSNQQNLVVFDDMITETDKSKLKRMSDLWIRGRKQNISTMYLSQNYFDIPKTMRKNNGILILKSLGTERDKRAILSEMAKDRTMEEMKAMFDASATEKLENFFMIDSSVGVNKALRYRHNFEPFVFT